MDRAVNDSGGEHRTGDHELPPQWRAMSRPGGRTEGPSNFLQYLLRTHPRETNEFIGRLVVLLAVDYAETPRVRNKRHSTDLHAQIPQRSTLRWGSQKFPNPVPRIYSSRGERFSGKNRRKARKGEIRSDGRATRPTGTGKLPPRPGSCQSIAVPLRPGGRKGRKEGRGRFFGEARVEESELELLDNLAAVSTRSKSTRFHDAVHKEAIDPASSVQEEKRCRVRGRRVLWRATGPGVLRSERTGSLPCPRACDPVRVRAGECALTADSASRYLLSLIALSSPQLRALPPLPRSPSTLHPRSTHQRRQRA
ncbi:hypothetical protein WN51_10063 [Melipona quadrifasciata]|uniref:Uncharacterized protein n=1 Tax=Melipona quadrifasciata TaxID=166423 RepID=A0A0M9A950_9HYME|nr:hypothetical protein WN51_10063 [Melipona quadrifasciata]